MPEYSDVVRDSPVFPIKLDRDKKEIKENQVTVWINRDVSRTDGELEIKNWGGIYEKIPVRFWTHLKSEMNQEKSSMQKTHAHKLTNLQDCYIIQEIKWKALKCRTSL